MIAFVRFPKGSALAIVTRKQTVGELLHFDEIQILEPSLDMNLFELRSQGRFLVSAVEHNRMAGVQVVTLLKPLPQSMKAA